MTPDENTQKLIAEFTVEANELTAMLHSVGDADDCRADLRRLHFLNGELLTVDGFRLTRLRVSGVSGHPHVCLPVAKLRRVITEDNAVTFRIFERYADVECDGVSVQVDMYAPEKINAATFQKLYPTTAPVFECAVTAPVFGDFAGLSALEDVVHLRFYGPTSVTEFACGELRGLIMPAIAYEWDTVNWRPWENGA